MVEAKLIIDVALVIGTTALTHATYRAVPAEHKATAKHHIRRVTMYGVLFTYRCAGNVWLCTYRLVAKIPTFLRHAGRWVAWTVTTPLRRR